MWFLYILLCDDNSFYTGIATDPQHRFLVHKSGKGARYTQMHIPIEILYIEELPTHSAAIKRELQIKKWSRKQKEKLVADGNSI